jgi:hypothetical protein
LAAIRDLSSFIALTRKATMKKILAIFLAAICLSSCDLSKYKLVKEYDFETVFESTDGKETATYREVIEYYQQLQEAYPTISLEEFGTTDSGEPLHLAVYSSGEEFDLNKIREENSIIFINNGIHPGESDGIDATMMLFRDLAEKNITTPKNTILVTIPYIILGVL